jgi:hypothetical protein
VAHLQDDIGLQETTWARIVRKGRRLKGLQKRILSRF